MRPWLALVASLALLPALRSEAISLQVDPAQSHLTPQVGSAESLSGTLDVVLGAVPVVSNTTLDVVALDLTASGGATIGLDPAAPSPGLGVVTPAGSVLIGTLFLRVVDGASVFDLAIPDVPGQAGFGPGGALRTLTTAFQIDTGGAAGLLDVTLFAVPEPRTAALLALAILALVARRAARPPEAVRCTAR